MGVDENNLLLIVIVMDGCRNGNGKLFLRYILLQVAIIMA